MLRVFLTSRPMKSVYRNLGILVLASFLIASATVSIAAATRIKVLKVSVTNPTDEARLDEDVVLSVAELKRVAPDFKAGDAIVTTSEAATPEEDARTLQTVELPSQADVAYGDNKYGELAFQIDWKAGQPRIGTIA